MYITIEDYHYKLSAEAEENLTNLVAGSVEEFLVKIPPTYRIMGEQVARKLLYDKEKEAIKAGYSKEEASQLRPDKDESPIHKLMSIALSSGVTEALKDFNLILTLNGPDISGISYDKVNK